MILDIPDIRQRADYSCGAACLEAVAQFHGLTARGIRALANPVQGMAPDTVEAWFRGAGLAVLSGSMGVDDLRHLTRSGRPVVCCVSQAGGHWVVVSGVSRGRVYYHCPTHGASSVPVASWVSRWSDETVRGVTYHQWGICPWPTSS